MTNSTAIYPGTFDPVTLGHEDVIERAARLFGRLTVAVSAGRGAKQPLFSLEERMEMLRTVTARLPNVEVDTFDGLLVDYARARGCAVLVRGLRAFSDFEYEFQMALANRKMVADVETVFLMPKADYSYVSSSIVREVAALGGAIREFVSPEVAAVLARRFPQLKP